VRAECVVVDINVAEALSHADVVFSGIVTRTDDIDDRLEFRVDRVWKGTVGRETWIYQRQCVEASKGVTIRELKERRAVVARPPPFSCPVRPQESLRC
jgi:hypothetical protein